MTDISVAYEYLNNIEGLKQQIATAISIPLMLVSCLCALVAWIKSKAYNAFAWLALLMASMMMFIYGTEVACGCDFNEDSGGCSAACAYIWEDRFFTLEYIQGVWDGCRRGIELPAD